MKLKSSLAMVCTAFALSACGSLHDVRQVWCDPVAAPAPVAAPVVVMPPEPMATTQAVRLSADALFGFDRSKPSDLLPAGRQSLDKLAEDLKRDFVRVDSISVTGHTDRLGPSQYNQALGLRRAETVRSYLQSRGVTAPMEVASDGENQPVSTGCGAPGSKAEVATPALKACLQVDRRVEVTIKGVKPAQ